MVVPPKSSTFIGFSIRKTILDKQDPPMCLYIELAPRFHRHLPQDPEGHVGHRDSYGMFSNNKIKKPPAFDTKTSSKTGVDLNMWWYVMIVDDNHAHYIHLLWFKLMMINNQSTIQNLINHNYWYLKMWCCVLSAKYATFSPAKKTGC